MDTGILPGMAEYVAKQQEEAGRVNAERMTEELNQPLADITEAAGQMEAKSPLFRGSSANPQSDLFAVQIERKGETQ
jgi:hypothetical protein